MSKRFAIVGAAGFVARRHAEAIRAVGGEIVAVVDPHDSVGWIDQYAPRASYYSDLAPFIAAANWSDGPGAPDFAVICTPNDLHAGQALALSEFCRVIVEKPVALTAADVETIAVCASHPVHPILNARCSREAERLRDVAAGLIGGAAVDVRYVAPRGAWYAQSWKGDFRRSGGIVTNIGVHVLDLLLWAFGPCSGIDPVHDEAEEFAARLDLERARVSLRLSTGGQAAERSVTVNGERFDLGDLFGTHVESYRRILDGRGWTLDDAAPAIALCERLRG